MWKRKSISVVLPTYNEKASIKKAINDFYGTGLVDEVIVVDNNAVPGTKAEVLKTKAVLTSEPKQGYGFAIRKGLREAHGDIIIIAEPDGTFSARDLNILLAYYDEGFDAVFGTRTTKGLIWEGANMGFILKWGNIIVAKMVELLFLSRCQLTDVGCTLKLFTRESLDKIEPFFTIGGSSFGLELVILTITHRLKFIEVPINYLPRIGKSSVTGSFLKTALLSISMIFLTLRYRLFIRRSFPEKISCPSCHYPYCFPYLKALDNENHSSKFFTYYRCALCQKVFLHPRPPSKSLVHYYQSSYYRPNKILSLIQNERLNLVSRFLKNGRILDYGCGDGIFLSLLKKNYQPEGYDISKEAAGYIKNHYHIDVHTAPSSLKGQYDGITLWHTLEHLADPGFVLKSLRPLLKKDGLIIIAVPNIQSFEANLTKNRWFHLDPPRHLFHYNRQSLSDLLENSGYQVVKTTQLSLEYDFASLWQSLLNFAGSYPNFFYHRFKRQPIEKLSPVERVKSWIITIILGPLLIIPVIITVPLLSLINQTGSITIYARKSG